MRMFFCSLIVSFLFTTSALGNTFEYPITDHSSNDGTVTITEKELVITDEAITEWASFQIHHSKSYNAIKPKESVPIIQQKHKANRFFVVLSVGNLNQRNFNVVQHSANYL